MVEGVTVEVLDAFSEWAWARHHNVLSWYIRPLFLVPFCYFAYRRSPTGIALTLVSLATSMFWFPTPTEPSPAVLGALRAEKDYLLGPWHTWKFALALVVPLTFLALGAAFWRRSVSWGLVVLNGMVLVKVLWTLVFFDRDSVWAHLAPAFGGLVVCDAVILAVSRVARRRDTVRA